MVRLSKRALLTLALGIAAGALTLVILPTVSFGEKACYFDATCGRLRKVTEVLGVTIRDNIEETELSRRYCALVGEPGPPEWRFAYSVTSNGLHEDSFDSGYGEGMQLALTLEIGDFSDDAAQALLVWFFEMIKDRDTLSGSYNDYSRKLIEVIDLKANATITLADLPPFPAAAAKAQ